MKHILENNVITLFLEGAITSSTAPEVEEEIEKIVRKAKFGSMVLDLDGVSYLSSAGLRIVLKYKQRYKDVKVTNASPEVYDVLQMTGFTSMMEVKKKLVEIDVSNCKLIGEGFFSSVYRIDKDTIIKVFRKAVSMENVERELNLAKEAFVLGVPTAISYDVVKVGDQLGVRFEMLDCASLRDCFRDHPEQEKDLAKRYAELLTTINTTETVNPKLPKTKDQWLQKVETCKAFLSKEEHAKLLSLISSIEERDTFVHGDCHFKNIMVQGNDLLLIDMDTLSKGHPIFELAAIYATYIAFEEASPGNNLTFLGIDGPQVKRIFREVLDYYFGGLEESTYQKIALVSYCHMVWWNETFDPTNTARHDVVLRRLKETLAEVNDLDIGK